MMDIYDNIVFMKYGVHASEDADKIVDRKAKEIASTGIMYWGYGGTLCHPLNQIQPFANDNLSRGQKTYLLMSRTISKLNNEPQLATKFSMDKVNWISISEKIKITGSKYALICTDFRKCNFKLDLGSYFIPIGNSRNKLLSEYVRGRVDKACGCRFSDSEVSSEVEITLCAQLVYPFAVFLQ